MTPEQFCYWLQGFNEIRDKEAVGLTEREWDIVREHLQEVFKKVTPDRLARYREHTQDNPNIVPLPYKPEQPGDVPPKLIC